MTNLYKYAIMYTVNEREEKIMMIIWTILLYALGTVAGAFTLFCVVMAFLEMDFLPGLLLLFIGSIITCALIMGGWECQNAIHTAILLV